MAEQDGDTGDLREVEERLARLPKVEPRAGFRDELRQVLTERAAQVLGPSAAPSRQAPEGPYLQKEAGTWRALAAVAAIVILIGGAFGGWRLAAERRLAALPKLPAPLQVLVGVGGRWPPVKEAHYELATPLPRSPRSATAYAPELQPFTADEARTLAASLGFTGPLIDMGDWYRFESAPGHPEEGRLLDVSRSEARVAYNDYTAAAAGSALSPDQAVAAAKAFLDRTGLPFKADLVRADLMSDRDQYDVQLIQSVDGRPALGFQTHVWVHRQGGAVAGFYFVRVGYRPIGSYPVITAREAFEKLKTQTVYAEHEVIFVSLTSVEPALYNYPRMDLPTADTRMQPTYVFSGVDDYGQPFQAFVPAVQDRFLESPPSAPKP